MSDIAWTDELRARVYSSRTFPNPAYRDAQLESVSLAYPIDPEKARASAAYYWKNEKQHLARAKAGLTTNPAAWRPAVEAALARCAKPDADHALDVDVEAATVTLELCPLFAAMPYWLSAGGIPFALRALIRCHELVNYAWRYGYTDRGAWIIETRDCSIDWPDDNHDAWGLMRAMLADAIEPVYDEAHGIADEARLRHAGGKPDQSALALLLPFAFPDEQAWAKEGAAAAIGLAKQAKRGHTPGLAYYLSVAPVETAIELLTCTINDAVNADDVLAIFAHQGTTAGLRVLEVALERAPNEDRRKGFLDLLLAIRTPEAAKLFERLAKKGKTFAKYAERYWKLYTPVRPAKAKAKRKPRARK
jgi:hypothetical protein